MSTAVHRMAFLKKLAKNINLDETFLFKKDSHNGFFQANPNQHSLPIRPNIFLLYATNYIYHNYKKAIILNLTFFLNSANYLILFETP